MGSEGSGEALNLSPGSCGGRVHGPMSMPQCRPAVCPGSSLSPLPLEGVVQGPLPSPKPFGGQAGCWGGMGLQKWLLPALPAFLGTPDSLGPLVSWKGLGQERSSAFPLELDFVTQERQ